MKSFILILLVILPFKITPLLGCSCLIKNEELTYEEYLEYSQISLIRVIRDGELSQSAFGMRGYWAEVEVIQSFKGNSKIDTIWSDYSSCGRSLNPSNDYIYYGSEWHEKPFVGYCSRTKSNSDGSYGNFDQELNFLKKINTPAIDPQKITYSNGQQIGKGEIIDEKLNGDWEFYFPDGTIMGKGRFDNNKKEGIWIESYMVYFLADSASPIRTEIGNYQNGVRKGKWEIQTYDPISERSWARIKEYD